MKLLKNKKESNKTPKNPYFDKNKSILHYKDKLVKIRKFSDQYHTLRVIFSDSTKTDKEYYSGRL